MEREKIELYVYQYLVEKGYSLAAMAMREQSGIAESLRTVEDDIASGMLLHELDELDHFRQMEKGSNSMTQKKAKFDATDFTVEGVDNNVTPSHPMVEYGCINDRHSKNIICCQLCSNDNSSGGEDDVIVSGGADRVLVIGKVAGLPDTVVPSSLGSSPTAEFKAPILCIDKHPTLMRFIIGLMDGSTFVLDGSGGIVCEGPKHSKYAVRVGWSPCGKYFCTASYDKTLEVWEEGSCSDGESDVLYTRKRVFKYEGSVECFEFAPVVQFNDSTTIVATTSTQSEEEDNSTKQDGVSNPKENKRVCGNGEGNSQDEQHSTMSSGDDGVWELIVGVRGDCCLHCYEIEGVGEYRINMNELGDDFVSFSPRDIRVSPSGKYLLVATDKDRVLLISRAAKCLVKVFYGATNDEYSNPRCCWDKDGVFVFSTSQTNEVVVWEAKTQRVVAKLQGHTASIRDMQYSAKHNVLITASFDKTIRIWGADVAM
eukprot:m.18069 g.18069  ORF g.18069 m.18069 type:complete len:484 (-) comp8241_c0_seq1:48-1499(-)